MVRSIVAALMFNGIDLVTGVLCAIKEKDIQSKKLRDGMFKKIGFIICYVTAFLIDSNGAEVGFYLGFNILPAIITYAVITEVVSIIENVCQLNPDLLPQKLTGLFHISEFTGRKES